MTKNKFTSSESQSIKKEQSKKRVLLKPQDDTLISKNDDGLLSIYEVELVAEKNQESDKRFFTSVEIAVLNEKPKVQFIETPRSLPKTKLIPIATKLKTVVQEVKVKERKPRLADLYPDARKSLISGMHSSQINENDDKFLDYLDEMITNLINNGIIEEKIS
ncbi:MAG: hypothetical protein ACRC42_04015 [Mycoplasma sp.]